MNEAAERKPTHLMKKIEKNRFILIFGNSERGRPARLDQIRVVSLDRPRLGHSL